MPNLGSRPPGLGVCSGKGVIGGFGPVVGVGGASGVGWTGAGVEVGAGGSGVFVGGAGGALGWQAVASSASSATMSRLASTERSDAFRGEVQKRRHTGV